MSRVSIGRRIDRIQDHILPPGSWRWRVEQLSDDLRSQWLTWRERSGVIISRYENEPGAAYAALLDDPDMLPPMPLDVERALYPEMAAIRAERDVMLAYELSLQMGR